MYRSAFPIEKNFSFLETLKLKSVITLVPEEMPENLLKFYEDNNIELFQKGVPGNKEPFVDIPDEKVNFVVPYLTQGKIVEALQILLDIRNHPVLVHCNKVCLDFHPLTSGKTQNRLLNWLLTKSPSLLSNASFLTGRIGVILQFVTNIIDTLSPKRVRSISSSLSSLTSARFGFVSNTAPSGWIRLLR